MSLRLHDCLRDVDYLLYLFGRAFITLTRPSPPLPPTLSHSLSFGRTKARRAYEQTGSQITIDPYALRLREKRALRPRDSFSRSQTRGIRAQTRVRGLENIPLSLSLYIQYRRRRTLA